MKIRDRLVPLALVVACVSVLAYAGLSEDAEAPQTPPAEAAQAAGSNGQRNALAPAQRSGDESSAPGAADEAPRMAEASLAPGQSSARGSLSDEVICPDPGDCACASAAALAAFETRHPDAALRPLEAAAPECRAAQAGLEAEALARMGRSEEAGARASRVLATHPDDAHAQLALGLAAYRAGHFERARDAAKRSLDAGRGAAAHLLLGLVAYQTKSFDEAKQRFESSIQLAPDSPDAHFNLGVLSQRTNRYREARESYLKTLSLDAEYLDARYNLVLLTQANGAAAEATHHFRKLEAAAGRSDARVARLAPSFAAAQPSAPVRELRLGSTKSP